MGHINSREAQKIIKLSVDNAPELDLSEDLPLIAADLLAVMQNRGICGIGETSVTDVVYRLGRFLAREEKKRVRRVRPS